MKERIIKKASVGHLSSEVDYLSNTSKVTFEFAISLTRFFKLESKAYKKYPKNTTKQKEYILKKLTKYALTK